MSVPPLDRRTFVLTAASAGSILGANDRVRVALIGCGGRGRYVARVMRDAPNTEFVAACDVYEPNASAAREWAGPDARAYADFRQVLERKDIDAVLIATPDHWHAIPAVLACQAGKHVYVEKPLALTIREGRAIVEAAKQSKAVFLMGTQQRSATHFPEVAEMVRNGRIGDVRYVRVWNFVNLTPDGIGSEPDAEPPAGLDWDFWLGPAPKVPYNRKRFLSTYRYFFAYSGGFITDYGNHRFDTVHQIMGVDAPRTVAACGGRFSVKGAGDVPDTLQVTYEYPGFVMSYEMSNLNGHGLGGRTEGMRYYNARGALDRPNGMAFYGTDGTIFADRIGYEVFAEPVSRDNPAPRVPVKRLNTQDATPLHARHFIDCIRGLMKPVLSPEDGHRATAIAHLGDIAYWTGHKLRWDAAREAFEGDAGAASHLTRAARPPWDIL
ncbi:MAG: Gfo/Idh/MocA family oxidoreductase [Bryobacterales bacterium]|nr:Gfo/Idh/MocA family oxidoreductase [Bryobacterales bacterium]